MLNLRRKAKQILKKWEKFFAALSDQELLNYTGLLRDRHQRGASPDNLLPEAFAAIREATFREFGYSQTIEQLMAGISLFEGKLVEMKTGEGKTLAFTAPAYLATLAGKGVHIVTANEYLARRDCQSMGAVFARLGISCSVITASDQCLYQDLKECKTKHFSSDSISPQKISSEKLHPCSRKEAYQTAITYGTASAFGFDYLRDNLVKRLEEQVQPQELAYVFLDEADNILLDEARTPLILTGPGQQLADKYYFYMGMVERLKEGRDYEVNKTKKTVNLTEKGIERLENWMWIGSLSNNEISLYDGEDDSLFYIYNCLKALTLFQSPDDYLVISGEQDYEDNQKELLYSSDGEEFIPEWGTHKYYVEDKPYQENKLTGLASNFSRQTPLREGQIIIIDKNTGRPLPGRRFQNGLHEALEAREYLKIQPAMVTLATISLQSFFRLYTHLAGMSGTLYSDRQTFRKLYGLEVTRIPTHSPVRRYDDRIQVFRTQNEAMTALVEDALRACRSGAPVLVGTSSLVLSEKLADILASKHFPFYLLNARHTNYEAGLIAMAGRPGRLTIATNMAGRGTDIKLGGSFENHRKGILEERGLVERVDRDTPEWNNAVEDARRSFINARKTAFNAGGLHVLGLGLQASKRLDEQLVGRSGRQGDPGFSRLYISLEDSLVQQCYGGSTSRLIARLHEKEKRGGKSKKSNEYNEVVPISNSLATKIVEECQRKIEGQNYDNLRLGFEFDMVLDNWRSIFYQRRKLILKSSEDKLRQSEVNSLVGPPHESRDLIESLDEKWTAYLIALDELREGIAFQALAGRKLISAYREEALKLFTHYFGTLL